MKSTTHLSNRCDGSQLKFLVVFRWNQLDNISTQHLAARLTQRNATNSVTDTLKQSTVLYWCGCIQHVPNVSWFSHIRFVHQFVFVVLQTGTGRVPAGSPPSGENTGFDRVYGGSACWVECESRCGRCSRLRVFTVIFTVSSPRSWWTVLRRSRLHRARHPVQLDRRVPADSGAIWWRQEATHNTHTHTQVHSVTITLLWKTITLLWHGFYYLQLYNIIAKKKPVE